MKLNTFIKIRTTTEMKNQIKDISDKLGFKEQDLARYLINRGLMQLKADIQRAGDISKLEFTLRKN